MLLKRESILRPFALLLGSIAIFLAAFATRMAFVPNVVPIAAVEEQQALWMLETAFLLKAVEYIAGFGAVIVLMALVLRGIGLWLRAPSPTLRG
jgi:hypothetical protein